MFVIPDDFKREMIALHEDEGRVWLDRLPAILAACEERWGITIGSPFANLSFHYVARAVRADGTSVVVKACSPTGEFFQESTALRLFDGQGMAQLLACDTDDEVMLLESLQPGTVLTTMEDDERAISIAAGVMRRLWRPVPTEHPFKSVFDWGKGFIRLRQHFDGGNGPFPKVLLEEAETLYAELSTSMAASVLLHGDLHQDNILAATRQPWLAIDPKGLTGEPAYETGSLLRNPLPQLLQMPQPGRVLARRIDQLADELGLDRGRIRNWGLAQSVLAAWWSVEDFGSVSEDQLTCASLLAEIKGEG
ncbi:MAG: aminoglycoside phosphotransferase family protein [Ktedonobacteraceae bacterium]